MPVTPSFKFAFVKAATSSHFLAIIYSQIYAVDALLTVCMQHETLFFLSSIFALCRSPDYKGRWTPYGVHSQTTNWSNRSERIMLTVVMFSILPELYLLSDAEESSRQCTIVSNSTPNTQSGLPRSGKNQKKKLIFQSQ